MPNPNDRNDPPSALPTLDAEPARIDFLDQEHSTVSALADLLRDTFQRQANKAPRSLADFLPGFLRHQERNAFGTFRILLDGAWGSGKSSLLGLLRHQLESESRPDQRPVVVQFNAWRHQSDGLLWSALLAQTLEDTAATLKWSPRKRALFWWRRRSFTNMGAWGLPRFVWILLLTIFVIEVLLIPAINSHLTEQAHTGLIEVIRKVAAKPWSDPVWTATAFLVGLIGTLLAIPWTRFPGQGSSSMREYLQRRPRMLAQIQDLLGNRLAKVIKQPLCIFVEDLDRCDANTVVETLAAIETLFCGHRTVFVVAASRPWIIAAYERVLPLAAPHLIAPGRSPGDPFLARIFQLTIDLPLLSSRAMRRYAEQATTQTQGALGRQNAPRTLNGKDVEDPKKPGETTARDDTMAAISYLDGTPRSVDLFLNYLKFHNLLRERQGRTSRGAHLTLLGWAIIRSRWPNLADFLRHTPEACRYLPRDVPQPDSPAAPLPFPPGLVAVFATPAYLRFSRSRFMPKDPSAFLALVIAP